MRKDILDSGLAISGPEKEVGAGAVKKWTFENGWPSKWLQAEDSALPTDTLGLIAELNGDGVAGLLLPAVQKVAPADNMPFTFIKVTDQDSLDALARIDDSFDDNVVFLDPGGDQGSAGVFLKITDIKGETQDEQDTGAWSPLSDFSSDTDIIL